MGVRRMLLHSDELKIAVTCTGESEKRLEHSRPGVMTATRAGVVNWYF